MRTFLLGTTAIIAAGATSQVHAQTADVAPSAFRPQNAEAAAPLDEIIVTAQRRSENLQKAAVPVTVVTGDALATAQVSTPEQLSRLVPSLAVQSGGGANTTFFVRGVGNFTNNAYSDPAIAFNYDGVYVGRPTSTSGAFYDLERVEMLPGPQGTLYGRNATAGALNIIPKQPVLGQLSASALMSYGNYDAINAQGSVNAPLGGSAAFRLAGNLVKHDGYLSDGTSDQRDSALRAQILGEFGPDLTVRFGVDWAHQGGKGIGYSYATFSSLNQGAGTYSYPPTPFDPEIGILDPKAQSLREARFVPVIGRTLRSLDSRQNQDNTFFGVTGEVKYQTPLGALTLIPAYRSAKLDNIFHAGGGTSLINELQRQHSLEVRLAGERHGALDYMLGGYYFHETVDGNDNYNQEFLWNLQTFRSRTDSYAAFARITAHLADRLRLVGGLRYTKDKKQFDGVSNVVTLVCAAPACPTAPGIPASLSLSDIPFPIPAVGGTPLPVGSTGALAIRIQTVVDQGISTGQVTAHAGVELDLTPTSLLYANFENGYHAGGFALAAGFTTYAPEYIDAYTIGSKNRFFGGRLQVNIEAFYWKYRNQQVSHSGIDANGNPGFLTENAGASTNKGVAIDIQARPATDTLLTANVQYLDARFNNFLYTLPNRNPPQVGCPYSTNPANAATFLVNCSGQTSFNAPRWTLNLNAQQRVSVGNFNLVLDASTQFKTSQMTGFEYLQFERTPSYWSSNASITLEPRQKNWSISAFVRNIENRRIVFTSTISNIGSGTVATTPPRTYGMRLGATF
ncbi:TonB-dependent receptor [Novosphingobium flavum]|uniref:TonB-dependent receptor n=1 Tax=Novosphingobium flavum TaxID=1778672 RepID=A0A7X1FRM7_9SPHN|nr:TonB-dependent receptor [Novosphingobium flavum]MBC2665706.1 TonB-dependent receptor [Novosphingobium flavum]